MGIIWTIIIGFVAGIIAKLIHPGPNEPSGFNPDDRSGDSGGIRRYVPVAGPGLVPRR